jgi:poly-gamma-glutamate synthesis protein (capsule biosynthesis protein)
MANNHAVDYGVEGLRDTLDAAASAPVSVVGIGADDDAAFAPAVVDIRGTTIAVIGATDVPDRTAATWAAGPGGAGVAWARDPERLLRSVCDAVDVTDVVGAHAHVLLGAGWLGRTYVSYGLGNFVWYSPNSTAEATSGVLTLSVHDGAVVADSWTPTFTEQDGLPRVLTGSNGDRAVASWRALRDCTELAGSLDAAEAMS